MMNTLLSLLLSLQLAAPVPAAFPAQNMPLRPAETPHAEKVWWGLIDPELSLWFAHIPGEDAEEPILWDWSWRNFFAALFPQSLVKEADHAPAV